MVEVAEGRQRRRAKGQGRRPGPRLRVTCQQRRHRDAGGRRRAGHHGRSRTSWAIPRQDAEAADRGSRPHRRGLHHRATAPRPRAPCCRPTRSPGTAVAPGTTVTLEVSSGPVVGPGRRRPHPGGGRVSQIEDCGSGRRARRRRRPTRQRTGRHVAVAGPEQRGGRRAPRSRSPSRSHRRPRPPPTDHQPPSPPSRTTTTEPTDHRGGGRGPAAGRPAPTSGSGSERFGELQRGAAVVGRQLERVEVSISRPRATAST